MSKSSSCVELTGTERGSFDEEAEKVPRSIVTVTPVTCSARLPELVKLLTIVTVDPG